MKIAVNIRVLIDDRLEGIGWFAYETHRRITTQHPERRIFFRFDRKPSARYLFAPNITPAMPHHQPQHPILWYVWFEWRGTSFMRRHAIDLFSWKHPPSRRYESREQLPNTIPHNA